jgi:hypothetical protein
MRDAESASRAFLSNSSRSALSGRFEAFSRAPLEKIESRSFRETVCFIRSRFFIALSLSIWAGALLSSPTDASSLSVIIKRKGKTA